MNEVNCPLCNDFVPSLALLAHTPTCYRSFCQKLGVEPYCTCNSCEGRRTHSDDSKKRKKADDSHDNNSRRRKRSVANDSDGDNDDNDDDDDDEICSTLKADPLRPLLPSTSSGSTTVTTRQLDGSLCCVCNKAKAPSSLTLPLVRLGGHRKLKICKKTHLAEREQRLKLESVITSQVKIIKEEGDISVTGTFASKSDLPVPGAVKTCHSTDENGEKCAKEGTLIWIRDGCDRFFCSAPHATSFFLAYYCKKGRKVARQVSSQRKDDGEVHEPGMS